MDAEGALPTGKSVLTVADTPARAAGLERLATAFGGLHVLAAGFEGAIAQLSNMAAPAAVFVDAGELGGDRIMLLGELARACAADRVPVTVMLTADQLDDVGGMLVGNDAVLLCEADAGEVAAAFALAIAELAPTIRDASADTARLQRIQDEVSRFAATLIRIVDQSEDAPAGLIEGTPFIAEPGNEFGAPEIAIDPAELRRAIRTRRMREDVFAMPGLFEDPAWDMLLDLFAAELERRQVSVSSLCIAAAVAPTTALRWIGKLIDAGLLERQPDAFDRRRAYISLTARASVAMRNYVATVRRAGLAIA